MPYCIAPRTCVDDPTRPRRVDSVSSRDALAYWTHALPSWPNNTVFSGIIDLGIEFGWNTSRDMILTADVWSYFMLLALRISDKHRVLRSSSADTHKIMIRRDARRIPSAV